MQINMAQLRRTAHLRRPLHTAQPAWLDAPHLPKPRSLNATTERRQRYERSVQRSCDASPMHPDGGCLWVGFRKLETLTRRNFKNDFQFKAVNASFYFVFTLHCLFQMYVFATLQNDGSVVLIPGRWHVDMDRVTSHSQGHRQRRRSNLTWKGTDKLSKKCNKYM